MKKKPFVFEKPSYPRGSTEVIMAHAQGELAVARLATEIATRFALIAAIPEGEDSAGRQKMRLPTAQELASRSCDIADALASEYEARGWLFDIPAPKLSADKDD